MHFAGIAAGNLRAGRLEAVAPVVLDDVHCVVGGAHQLHRSNCRKRIDAHADTCADTAARTAERKRIVEHGQNLARTFVRFVIVCKVIEHDHKFVASYARYGIVRPKMPLQAGADRGKQFVTRGVSELVVDRLKTVDVQKKDGAKPFAALRSGD